MPRVRRRLAENYYFIEHPPETVDPENLLRFETALPSWFRPSFDPLPPDEARRRLTILYRLVYPHPQEMPVEKAPRPSPRPRPPRRSPPSPSPPWAPRSRRGVAMADRDAFWMRRALAEAERGRGAVEPNPMVGAVVVRDGVPVGVGHHARFGGPHAEVEALAAAGDRPGGPRSS